MFELTIDNGQLTILAPWGAGEKEITRRLEDRPEKASPYKGEAVSRKAD